MKILLLMTTLVWMVMAQTPTVSVKIVDFPGLQVVLATDPSVQIPVAAALRDNPAPEIAALLPYSLLLQNNTGHRISVYTLRLSFVDAAGKSGGQNRQYFNLEPASNGMEILPGATRLISPTVSLDATVRPTAKTAQSRVESGFGQSGALAEYLQSQAAVLVSLDVIVFDTGQVIGPDEGNTLSYVQGYIAAEREAASIVKTELRRSSRSQVADHMKNMAQEFRAQHAKSKSYDALARATVVGRLALLVESSEEKLKDEVERILAKPVVVLYR